MAFQDIRKTRKWLSDEEVRLLILVLIILGALLTLNIYLARVLPGGEFLYQHWSAARAFLAGQTEPYSVTLAERVQQVAYGRPAFSSEYPYRLNDPFYIVLLYIPVGLISNFEIARGIWMLLSEFALVGTVIYSLRLLEWEPPRWLFFLLLLFGVFNYFSLIALGSGTPSIIFSLIFVIVLTGLRSSSDELTGALLFLIAYQWEVNALFFLFVIFLVFVNRRWKVLVGFGMSLFVMLAISFLSYPGWSLPYARGVLSDWERSMSMNFGHMLAYWFPNAGISLGFWSSMFFGIILLLEWIGSFNSHYRRIAWTTSLSLAVTPLIGFAIFPSNQVVLLPAFILIVMLVWERWTRQRVIYTLLILILAFLVPFGMYARLLMNYDRNLADVFTLLPQIGIIAGLYWMRWWAVRTPRTWFDQLGDRK